VRVAWIGCVGGEGLSWWVELGEYRLGGSTLDVFFCLWSSSSHKPVAEISWRTTNMCCPNAYLGFC